MMNRLTLIGHLGDDPKLNVTPKGNKVASFPLPLYHYSSKPGDKGQWIECQVWNKLAEKVVESQKVGKMVYVEGELHHSYKKNEKGEWSNRTFLSVSLIRFLSPRDKDGQEADASVEVEEYQQENPENVENLEQELEAIFSN